MEPRETSHPSGAAAPLATSGAAALLASRSAAPSLPREYFTRSNAQGALACLRILGGLAALVVLLPYAVAQLGPVAFAVFLPLLAASIHKLTFVMHDCGHNTLFGGQRANHAVGALCGALLGTRFETYKWNHWEHHRSFGRPGDPQGRDYLGLSTASRAAILWHLLRPLVGWNLFKLADLNTAPASDGRSSETAPRLRRRDLLAIAAAQLAIAALASDFGAAPWLALAYPATAGTLALFLSQLRGFCEHVAPAGSPSEMHVRTHLPHALERWFLYDLGFNYHVEHHLYPGVPSHHLAAVCVRLRAAGHHGEASLARSMLGTAFARLRAAA